MSNTTSKYVFIEVIEDQAYLIDFRIVSNLEEYKDVMKYIDPKYVFVTNRTDNDLVDDIFKNIDIFEMYDKEDKEDQKLTNDLQLYLVPQIEELDGLAERYANNKALKDGYMDWKWYHQFYEDNFERIMLELIIQNATAVVEKQMNTVHIWLCEAPDNVKVYSHQDVNIHIDSNNNSDIHTYDISWFSQNTISKGYNVIVYNGYGTIDLNKLLANKSSYTDREIRSAHNVYKMLMSNAFKFKAMEK